MRSRPTTLPDSVSAIDLLELIVVQKVDFSDWTFVHATNACRHSFGAHVRRAGLEIARTGELVTSLRGLRGVEIRLSTAFATQSIAHIGIQLSLIDWFEIAITMTILRVVRHDHELSFCNVSIACASPVDANGLEAGRAKTIFIPLEVNPGHSSPVFPGLREDRNIAELV